MEKQRNYKNFRSVYRLLILLAGFQSLLFAVPKPTMNQLKELAITPVENQDFSTDEEIKYILNIPEITPLSVEVRTPEVQDHITFKTFRRTGNTNGGTKIELWYEFSQDGEWAPAPLEVNISGKIYHIPFAKIYISKNQMSLKPEAVIHFSNGKTIVENSGISLFNSPASAKIRFTVRVRNAKKTLSADYDIPKDALLSVTKDFSLTEKDPYYEFEWTPLKKGKTRLPEIKFTCTAFDGSTVKITSPEGYINVTNSISSKTSSRNDRLFSDSFSETEIIENEYSQINSLDELAGKIAWKKRLYLKMLFICLAILVLVCTVLFMLKIKSPVPYLLLSVILILLMIIFAALSKKKTAVYTSGTVKSIPETNNGKVLQIQENTEIKILKDVGDWYCITSGNTTGWTQKENVRIY